MTEKRFYIENERTIKDNQKYITENAYVFSYKSDAEEVCDLLNDLSTNCCRLEKENEKLKKALLFYIDVSLCETSSNFYKDFDNICNNVFGCSYNEIKHLYSDIGDENDVFALFQR